MKIKSSIGYVLLMIVGQVYSQSNDIEALVSQMKPETYQDVLIDNQIVKEGVKNCTYREPYIYALLDRYTRPFTVVDIGASQGYFSLKIGLRYPHATCVMIEGDSTNKLPQICALNTLLHNVIVLERFVTVEDLVQLGKCEHIDVVLAFNVIHHFKHRWKEAIDALLTLADYVLIETPPADCHTAANKDILGVIDQYLHEHKRGSLIGRVPRYGRSGEPGPGQKYANFYLFSLQKTLLPFSSWAAANEQNYPIISTFHEKYLLKPRLNKFIPWQKGINLWTFKNLHGVYPGRESIAYQIKQLAQIPHGDFTPWNMIIQGQTIQLIDSDDQNFPEASSNAPLCLSLLGY